MSTEPQPTPAQSTLDSPPALHIGRILLIFFYIGALIFIVFIIGQILAGNKIHLDWQEVFLFTNSLKWPLLIFFIVLIYKNQIPNWGKSIGGKISSIVLNILGNQATLNFAQTAQEQIKPASEPTPEPPLIETETTESPTESKEKVNEPTSAKPTKEENVEDDKDARIKNLEDLSKFWKDMYDFERIYRNIFGSQLNVLTYINSNNGADLAQLMPFLSEHIQKTGGSVFNDILSFLNYLQKNELITWDTVKQKYLITDKGRKFLNFVIMQGLPLNKEG